MEGVARHRAATTFCYSFHLSRSRRVGLVCRCSSSTAPLHAVDRVTPPRSSRPFGLLDAAAVPCAGQVAKVGCTLPSAPDHGGRRRGDERYARQGCRAGGGESAGGAADGRVDPCWYVVWPSAVVLASALMCQREACGRCGRWTGTRSCRLPECAGSAQRVPERSVLVSLVLFRFGRMARAVHILCVSFAMIANRFFLLLLYMCCFSFHGGF